MTRPAPALALNIALGTLTLVTVVPALAQTTITFVATEAPATFADKIAAFERAHPDVKVEFQQIPFRSFNAQIEARLGSKDPGIDVYTADTPRVPTLAARGYLQKLDPLRSQIEAIATPTEVAAVSHQGTPYAFPMWTGSNLLFFNRSLLKQAGIAPPSSSPDQRITWEQLVTDARKAQQAGARFGFTFQQVDRYFQLQPLFESRGVGSGLTGPDLMTPQLTNDGWISVANWYRDLFESGVSPRGVTPEQTPDLFINGQVAYFYGGLPMLGRFGRVDNLDFGVAPVPYFANGKPASPTGSWALGISPFSTKQRAAIAFASFMTLSTEGAALGLRNTSAVPVNKSAYQVYQKDLAERNAKAGPVAEILTFEIGHTAVPRPRSVGYVVFEEAMNKAFSDIRNGSDVKQTLSQTERQLKSALARVR